MGGPGAGRRKGPREGLEAQDSRLGEALAQDRRSPGLGPSEKLSKNGTSFLAGPSEPKEDVGLLYLR